ncbi:MAG: hypothetical protein MRY83_12905 [Flavobacteriales bacterium]|nr:hypothetical protein [Flavobacteriales bacterium]
MTENERFEQIKELIELGETGHLTYSEAAKQINLLSTGCVIYPEEIGTYWKAYSLDDFVKFYSTDPIHDWEQIDDQRALDLINELFSFEPGIEDRNTKALDLRYNKPTGTTLKLKEEHYKDAQSILNKLKA